MRRLTHQVVLGVALLAVAAPSYAQADGGPTMPLSQVQAGMTCTGETVIQGTTISSFTVNVLGVISQAGEGPRILINVSGPAVAGTGIAEGFSGSPVYCPGPGGTMENAGAISESVGDYGNNLALVTPIEQMLGEPVAPPVGTPHLSLDIHPLTGPLLVSGLSPALLHVLQQAAAEAGRTVLAAPAAPFTTFPVQPLVPGASVAANYSTGAIQTGAIGTVTYADGRTVYAFGHPLDEAGRRALMLMDAYVYKVVPNPDPSIAPSYKLAAPGHLEGTLTSDTPNAVIGQLGSGPPLIPITVIARDLDTGQSITEATQVADETDVGDPLGGSSLDMVGPLAVAQAATDVYNGPPAAESGGMCLRITLRESTRPLEFCNRYVGVGSPGIAGFAPPELANGVGNDVGAALGLLDTEQFAHLHVTGVSATLTARRGLQEATILAARAPTRVRAGQRVRVRMSVQDFRGAVHVISFGVQIPRRAQGLLIARLHGPPPLQITPSGSAQGLAASLASAFGAGSGPPRNTPPPASLPELRAAFAAIPTYDGVEITFGRRDTRRVYRNPSLLVTGEAQLVFNVRR